MIHVMFENEQKAITFELDISNLKRLTYATKQTPSQTPAPSSE
jgi:hypothetical protein